MKTRNPKREKEVPAQAKQFKFRRDATIGSADAETDERFLGKCFVSTGDLDALLDCSDPKRIVVGRTGAGKSALLKVIKDSEENVIDLPPETLSLNYVANSDVIQFFEAAGVKLDIFYSLLWRHVFAVELLKKKYHITNESSKSTFLEKMAYLFKRDKHKERAIRYLEEWGEKFWQETEYRIKEFTTKLESELRASVGEKLPGISLDASAANRLTADQKQEVIHKGQRIVNEVQIRDLNEVINLLADEIFTDPQHRYYVTIDRLDENWVEERLRYKLIRALIETIRSFQRIRSVKIVVALRLDLIERVIKATRDAGFQEEKYESLYLRIRWTKNQLEELLDKRIAVLVREQYTTHAARLRDILPDRINSKAAVDYILDRTLLRPRDAILFINACLERAEGRPALTATLISDAEADYSRKRLRSLADEWSGTYVHLGQYANLLEGRTYPFIENPVND